MIEGIVSMDIRENEKRAKNLRFNGNEIELAVKMLENITNYHGDYLLSDGK